MNKIKYTGDNKFIKGLTAKVNWILDHLISDVQVNGSSVVSNNIASITVPVNTSDLNNDSGFITNTVNNLTNYYLNTQTYTKDEVNGLIAGITTVHFELVQVLPESGEENIIYLVPAQTTEPDNIYEEWVWISNRWECIGSTAVDLSNYVQKSLTVGLIKNDGTIDQTQYATMSDIPDELADLADDQTHRLVTDTDKTTWNDKRAVNLELMTEDLNDVKTVGFYVGKSSNTCTNKPSGVIQFGLYVVKLGTSNQYYKQILIQPLTVANGGSKTYSRALYQTTWTDWVEEKYTDTTYTASGLVSIDANNNITTTAEKNPKVATGSVFGSLSFDGTNKIVKLSADSQGSGLDLNDFKTAGEYYFDNRHTPTNIPNSNNNGVLIVIETDSIIKQIWMRHGTKDSNDYNTYVRTYYSSSNNWSIWHPLVTGEMISNVEATSTSSRAYSVGDYLVYIAYFYRVTQAIAIGDTIVTSGSSANVTRVYVGDEIESVRNSIPTAITSAINDLDVASTSIGEGETLATIKEENGKIAVTKQNIKIGLGQIDNFYRCGTQNAISGSNIWHKIASTTITAINTDSVIMLAVYDTYTPDTESDSDLNCGMLYCRVRQGGTLGTVNYAKLKFVANSGFDASKFRLYYTITADTSVTFEIWTSMNRRYGWRKYSAISQSDRLSVYNDVWTLYNSTSPTSAPTESSTCVRVECEDNTYKQTDNDTLGATNLIPYPYSGGSNASRNNVTISVNENGVITASGNAPSSGFGYAVASRTETIVLDPSKSYIMSGMTNGSGSKVRFLLDLWTASQNPTTDSYTTRLYQATTETTIPSGYKYLQISLYFYTGAASLFPLTVSPMLRLASIADSTFKTYADTNRNLSMNKANLRQIATVEKTSIASKAYTVGDYMIYDGDLCRVISDISSGGTITLNTNVYATTIGDQLKWKASSVSANEIEVKTTNTNIASGNASEIVIEDIRLYANSGVINNWFTCYRHIPLYNTIGYFKDCDFSWWDGNDSYYASISIIKSGNYIVATYNAAKKGNNDITTYSDFKMYITVSEKS